MFIVSGKYRNINQSNFEISIYPIRMAKLRKTAENAGVGMRKIKCYLLLMGLETGPATLGSGGDNFPKSK